MRLSPRSLFPLILLFFASSTGAIFADEAYQTDYHLALLGLPQAHTTFFHRPSPASKASLLYTLSERLVLGAVNPKDGAVIWRQQLKKKEDNVTGPGILRAAEGGDTLVSAVGDVVSSWDASDGRLVWEWSSQGRVKDVAASTTDELLVLSEEDGGRVSVKKLGVQDGAIIWGFIDKRLHYVQETSTCCTNANLEQWRYPIRLSVSP